MLLLPKPPGLRDLIHIGFSLIAAVCAAGPLPMMTMFSVMGR